MIQLIRWSFSDLEDWLNTSPGRAHCACKKGFTGDPHSRCYPAPQSSCKCRQLVVSSSGPAAQHQRDKVVTLK